jgi:hypothetical protein
LGQVPDAASFTALQVFIRKEEQLKWVPLVFAEAAGRWLDTEY